MDITLSRKVDTSTLAGALRTALPSLRLHVEHIDQFNGPADPQLDALLVLIRGRDVYPCGISVFAFPGLPDERVYVGLARLLSDVLACDAVCDGTLYVPVDVATGQAGPYWSLLWRRHEAWLADDAGTDAYDGAGGLVRPITRLTGPLPALAPDGSLIALRPGHAV